MSELSASLGTKLDKADVVDPGAEAESGQAADAKSTYEGLNRVLGVASDARVLAESKADKLTDRQLAAVNSGIDAGKVAKIAQNESAISAEVSRATTEEARLQTLINAIKTFEVVVADSLPDPSEQYGKKLYLIPSANPETRNVKDEFICVKIEDVWNWEHVGSTAITIEFDNEPTEGSQKAARSGGIWSWVKSLLPHWLTSDYAEPATAASVADKRDKSDLAVYSVTRTENTDWRVEVSGELADVFISDIGGVDKLDLPYHDEYYWYYGPSDIGGWHCDLPEESISELNPISSTNRYTVYMKGNDEVGVRFTRPRYMDETLGSEKPNQQLAAVATDDAAKPANGSLMKYDAANDRLVKAIEGTDYLKTHQDISGKLDATHDFDGENASLRWEAFYLAVRAPYGLYVYRGDVMVDEYDELGRYVRMHTLLQKADKATTLEGYGITNGATKTELAAKRDLTDNVCRKTEFTEWICNPPRTEFGGVYSIRYDSPVKVYSLFDNEEVVEEIYSPTDDKLNLEFVGYCTATRSAVCTSNEPFVTKGYVDGEVSAAVSTNNPAFVSAVRNTPAPEPGQGEDPPWGTWGTVGAAIAGLVAGLEWVKNILGSVASGYSTFAEWIASKYTKPSGGIPASDLALTVQSSLDAADAAAPQATTYTKDETDAAIHAGASLGQMTNLGNGRYEYTGALSDASTQTYPREVA